LFLGHFATAYAAKRLAPRTSLGMLGWAGLLGALLLLGLAVWIDRHRESAAA